MQRRGRRRLSQRGLDPAPRWRGFARTKWRMAITASLHAPGDDEHDQRGSNPGATNYRRVNYRDEATTREFTPA
jgi:hypothetical protein